MNGTVYGLITIPPTLLVAFLWVRVLRWPATVGKTNVRKGWLVSIPLAALNASLAAVLLLRLQMGTGNWKELLLAALAGATIGAIVWIPALILTLLCFGTPIAWAQRLAKQGLAGQERGEAVVGGVSAAIAIASLIATTMSNFSGSLDPKAIMGHQLTLSTACVGAILGLLTLLVAREREAKRRNFVADVEAGRVPQFRVDIKPEGKVLVRVVSQENSYRVADYEEEVAALNHQGAVVQALRVETD